ncbi:MAG: DUF924 family protein [Polaromonas sp.]
MNRCSADGRGRLHAKVDGHPIALDYLQRGEVLDLHHTGVDPALQVRGLAAKLVAHGQAFEPLDPLQRWFVLMPLEHAEDSSLQALCVAEFERLASADPRLEGALEYAPKHQAVIEQFGRFPHRNALLSRSSSAAEADYLAQPGAGF